MSVVIDEAIKDFAREHDDWNSLEKAKGQCVAAAEIFMEFLGKRRIKALTIHDRPDKLGYRDRTIEGYACHTVTLIRRGGHAYMVDWTAMQYGYEEYPMVQRRTKDGWVRDPSPNGNTEV